MFQINDGKKYEYSYLYLAFSSVIVLIDFDQITICTIGTYSQYLNKFK